MHAFLTNAIGLFFVVLFYMLKRLCLLLFFPLYTKAQDTIAIESVKIISYLNKQPLLRTPAAAAIIDSTQLQLQTSQSLVPALNTIAGVRMEERSPGSYRLSLRGSLLRSPFGVRNVKVYLNEYPLTDAGGNTYFNALAANAINTIEIIKGPDGSLFGANSGGVVTINSTVQKDTEIYYWLKAVIVLAGPMVTKLLISSVLLSISAGNSGSSSLSNGAST